MSDRQFAATAWEIEAERRRETIEADAFASALRRSDGAGDVLVTARGRRLLANLRGSFGDEPRQAGTLNQKRV